MVKLFALVAATLNLSAFCQQPAPALVIKGEVTKDVFSPWGTNSELSTKADFLVTVSNSFWEIELLYEFPDNLRGTGESCMRIADGIRVRPVFQNLSNAALLPAKAFPINYPPPGRSEFQVCWFGLVPVPELPLISGGRIRRFLDLKFRDDPRNEGTFGVEYLGPDNRFLKRLTLTNNGALFRSDGNVLRYKGALASGFLELRYEMTESTNWAGITMPYRGVLVSFALKPTAKTVDDLYAFVRTEFKVTHILSVRTGEDTARLSTWPTQYMALDARFPEVDRAIGVNYVVTNDAWNSTTNRQLRLLATIAKTNGQTPLRHKVVWTAIFLILVAAPVPIYFFLSGRIRSARSHHAKTEHPTKDL